MDEIIEQLEKEYCPPLDTALIRAIAYDQEDFPEAASLSEVRATLDTLKASAENDESAAFDPSGTSRPHDDISAHDSNDLAHSWNGDVLSGTGDTDLTSLSRSLDSLSIGSAGELEIGVEEKEEEDNAAHEQRLENLPIPEKEAILIEMFPDLKTFDISFSLKKHRYNFSQTVEDLLNQVFLEEDPDLKNSPRGIEAFSTPYHRKPKRKKRGKVPPLSSRRSSSVPSSSPISSGSPGPSKWDMARQDVDFITQRTYLSHRTVSSMYHRSGASLSATILALCASNSPPDPDRNENPSTADDPVIQAHAYELRQDFPSLPPHTLTALVHLTHPSTASAHELAKAITTSPTSTSTTTIITPHYTRPTFPLSDDPASLQIPLHQTQTPTPTPTTHLAATTAAANATTLFRTAYTRASHYHHLSKSSPLMAGAASYYALVGRESSATARHYTSLAADALVASQSHFPSSSSPSSASPFIDLHGTSVPDAVRITRVAVEQWWSGPVGEWAREGKVQVQAQRQGQVQSQGSRRGRGRGRTGDEEGGAFRIVTGVGRHSAGGRGRLGPAVGGMLVREGWRVEVGEGVLVVRGRVRVRR
ncbi:hypothetical protein MMC14_010403 [Varicellaria rhodocarpa]|nr:hypothetical protein [Varicellaria rhodocarpa]